MTTGVLKVSSKGQVVLPAKLRRALSILPGDYLAAYSSGDVLMLKRVDIPKEEDFKSRLDEAQAWAASVGYREEDVAGIIKSVREKKNA